jgi:hypothetical protein
MDTKWIAVDFDGTIAVTRYPVIVEVIPHAPIYLCEWRKLGHAVTLWTCREGDDLTAALEFCTFHGIQFDTVNANLPGRISEYKNDPRKIGADYFIDDKFPVPIADQWVLLNKILGG